MKLKEKTYKKFVDFFEKMAKQHGNNEFEIAYSEIQRDTGVASITLKKGIQVLEQDGVITVSLEEIQDIVPNIFYIVIKYS